MTTGEERTLVSVLECETITCYTRVTEGVRSGYTPRKSFFIAISTNPAAGNSVVIPVFTVGAVAYPGFEGGGC